MFIFAGTFFGLLVLGAVLYPYFSIAFAEELRGFMAVTASICGTCLGFFANNISVADRVLTWNGFSVEIIEECTGIFEMLIYTAAVLSYPASWKARGIGLLLGIPLLYGFNIARIVFLTIIGAGSPGLFKFMHLYFWQATLILMITSVWVLWILFVANRDKKASHILS